MKQCYTPLGIVTTLPEIEAERVRILAKVIAHREVQAAADCIEAERPVRVLAAMLHRALGDRTAEFLSASRTTPFSQVRELLSEMVAQDRQRASEAMR